MKTTSSELTEDEKVLLKQYQTLSTSLPNLANRLAVEVVPAVVFVMMWFFTGNVTPLIILISLMVIYNVQRVLRQHKTYKKLHSISKKSIGDVCDEEKE